MTDLSIAQNLTEYKPANKVRFVTAASLFDGHDASINIMRRILMANGAEVIHLGHNRSVDDIVTAALQEDAQGIALSSYQGGHVEYLKYMIDLLKQRGVALADAGSLDHDQVETGDLAGGDHVRQRLRDFGAGFARGQRAHEHTRLTVPRTDRIHADAVAQQCAAGFAARRVD